MDLRLALSDSRPRLDRLVADAAGHGWRLFFPDRHPHARLIHHGGMRLGHLNITVTDVDTATLFYGRWFGFDRVLAEHPRWHPVLKGRQRV